MSIILTILKVIGIILLIILLIILAFLLLLLFVPFRYSAGGRKEGDDLEFSAKVTWLLHAVTVQVGFEAGGAGLTKDLRIFGISLFKLKDKLGSGKKSSGSAGSEAGGTEEQIKAEEIAVPEAAEDSSVSQVGTEGNMSEEAKASGTDTKESEAGKAPTKSFSEGKTGDMLQEDGMQTPGAEETAGAQAPVVQVTGEAEAGAESAESMTEKPSDVQTQDVPVSSDEDSPDSQPKDVGSRIKAVYTKLTQRMFAVLTNIALRLNGIIGKLFGFVLKIFIRICLLPLTVVEKLDTILRKIGSICRKIGIVYDFFSDVRIQSFLSGIMGMVRKLVGHVLPKQLKGYVRFGLDDPGRTGRVLAAVAPFYPRYGKTFSLQPDFEELVLEGKAELKGRIYLFYIAFIGLRAILNKNTKYVIRQVKKLKEVR